MSEKSDTRPWQVWVRKKGKPQFRVGFPTTQDKAMKQVEKLQAGKYHDAEDVWCEEDV